MPRILTKQVTPQEYEAARFEQSAASMGLATAKTEPYLAAQQPLELFTARPTPQLDIYRRHILLADEEGLGDDDRYALSRLALQELSHGVRDDDGSKFFKREGTDAQNFVELREMFLSAEIPGEGKRFRQSERDAKIAEVSQWDEWIAWQNTPEGPADNMSMALALSGGTANPSPKRSELAALSAEEQDAWLQRYESEVIRPKDYTANKLAYERLLSDQARAYGMHAGLSGKHDEWAFYNLPHDLDRELMPGYVALLRGSQPQQDVSGWSVFANSYRRFSENGVELLRQVLAYTPDGVVQQEQRRADPLSEDTRLPTRQYLDSARPDYSGASLPARIGYGAVESIPFTASVLAGPGGMAFAAASLSGELQQDLVKNHGADPDKALGLSLIVGSLSVGMEAAQVAMGLGGGKALSQVWKTAAGSKVLAVLAAGSKTYGKELLVEEVQSGLEASVPLIAEAVAEADDNLDADDVASQLWQSLPETGGVVGIFSGIFGGAGFVANRLSGPRSTLEKVQDLNRVAEHIGTLPDGSDLAALRVRVDAEVTEDGKRNIIEGAKLTRESYARKLQEYDAIEEEVSGLMDAAAAEVAAAVEKLAGGSVDSNVADAAEVTAPGVDAAALQDFVGRFATAFPKALPVRVVQSVADLPAPVQELAKGTLGPKAAKHGGEVFVVLDNVSSFGDAIAQIAHEQLVHVGLDLRSPEGRQEFLSNLRTRLDASGVSMDSIRQAVSAYSGIADQVRERAIAAGIAPEVAQEIADNYLAEEFLARAVEKAFNGESMTVEEKGVVDVFLAWLRDLFGIEAGPDADRILLESAHELMVDLGGMPSLESQLAVAQRQIPVRRAASDETEAGMAEPVAAETVPEPAAVEEAQVPPVPSTPEETNVDPTEPQHIAPESAKFPVRRVRIADIVADPKRFQFKMETNQEGIQKALEGEWDEFAAGLMLLWESKDGQLYVANGHHRFSHAKALGVEALNAQIVRESDGISDIEARTIAAEANILDGKGTIYDHAEFFRFSKVYTEADARRRGVRGDAFQIGAVAGDDLYGQFRSNRAAFPAERVVAIVRGAGSNPVAQGLAIRKVLNSPKIEKLELQLYAQAMRLRLESGPAPVRKVDAHETMDFFADSTDEDILAMEQEEAERSQFVGKVVRELQDRLAAIKGTVASDSRVAAAAEAGIKVRNVEKTQATRDRLVAEIEALMRFDRHAIERARTRYGKDGETKLSLAEERAIVQPARSEERDLFGAVVSPGRPEIRERDVVLLPDGRTVTASLGMRFPAGAQVVGEQDDLFGGSAGPQGRGRTKKAEGPRTEQIDFFADTQSTLFSLREDAPLLILSDEILKGENPTIVRVSTLVPGISEADASLLIGKAKAVAAAVRRVIEDASKGIERTPGRVRLYVEEAFDQGQIRGELLGQARTQVAEARKRDRDLKLAARTGLHPDEFEDVYEQARRVLFPELPPPPRKRIAPKPETEKSAEDEVTEAAAAPEQGPPPAPTPLDPSEVDRLSETLHARVTASLKAEGHKEGHKDWVSLFNADLRKTWHSLLDLMASELAHGEAREVIFRNLAKLQRLHQGAAIESNARKILEAINRARVRESRADLRKRILKLAGKYSGRVAVTAEIEKRKIDGSVQQQINYILQAWKTPERRAEGETADFQTVDEIVEGLDREAERIGEDDDDGRLQALLMKKSAYEMFGGLGRADSTRTLADMQAAHDYLARLIDGGVEKVRAAAAARKAEVEPDRNALIDGIRPIIAKADSIADDGGLLDKALALPDQALRLKDRLFVLIRASEGSVRDAAERIVEKIDDLRNRAEKKRTAIIQEEQESLANDLQEIYGWGNERQLARGIADLVKTRPEFARFSDTGKQQLSRDNIIQIIACLEQSDVRTKAQSGENPQWKRWLDLEPELRKQLLPQDFELIRVLRDKYSKRRKALNVLHRRITGMDIVSPNALYSPARMEVQGGFGEKHAAIPVIPKSFEARTNHARDFDYHAGFLQIFQQRIIDDAHLLAYADWNRYVRGLFAHGDMQKTIVRAAGRTAKADLLEHLSDEATFGKWSRAQKTPGLDAFLSAVTTTGLGLNWQSATKSFVSGFPQFLQIMPAGRLAKFTVEGMTDSELKPIREKMKRDPRWKNRYGGALTDTRANLGWDSKTRRFADKALVLSTLSDKGVASIMGPPLYRFAYNSPEGMSLSEDERHEYAMGAAMRAIEETQLSPSVADRPAFLRRHGSIMRLLTLYQSPELNKVSRDVRAIRELFDSPDPRIRKKAVRMLLIQHILLPTIWFGSGKLLQGLVFGVWPWDDDDLRDDAGWLLAAMALGPLASLPIMGSIAVGLAEAITTGDKPFAVGEVPIAGAAKGLIHVGAAVGEAGEALVDSALNDFATMDWDEVLEELDKAAQSFAAPYRDAKKIAKRID